MNGLLLQLIQVAMNIAHELPASLSEEQWRALRKLSEEHRMLAFCYAGINRLPQSQRPPKSILIEWGLQSDLIKAANERRDYLCHRAFADLRKRCNMVSIVLKGQGNLINYPADLRDYRYPGDLDLWLGSDMTAIVNYVRLFTLPKEGIRYNHVDFPIVADVPIELHYRPIFLCQWHRNRLVQQWFKEEWERRPWVEYKDFLVADNRFNILYQLLHLFRHLFEEGIILRQLIDYVYVLRNRPADVSDEDIMHQVSDFGLGRFAHAVMWMVRQIDPDCPLYCSPDEEEGNYLWQMMWKQGTMQSLSSRSHSKTRNDWRLLGHYPGEAISEPIFRLWHALWRLKTRLFMPKLPQTSLF